MANLALPRRNPVRRLPVWTRLIAIAFVVVALMALSFALGRATIGRAGTAKPVVHTVTEPSGVTHGGVDCHQHEQC